MPPVIIKAFEQNRQLQDVPAAINYVGRTALESFDASSVVRAINTTPGIHMEERSPGSYRFNIRGSSLRSPFGVRNVKVYYNDIPITDPGGQTYLNQLGYYNFNSIEIIKGPGNSLYGAGTGGALLIESLSSNEQPSVRTEYSTGSYSLQNIYGSITTGNDKTISRASLQHLESNGYRNHSALNKDVHSWNGLFRFGDKKLLKTTFLYGDLFYQTPGALTKTEFDANSQLSRPATPTAPSAETANASVRQRQFIAGASYEQPLFYNFENKSLLYGMFTELRNPTLQNYARNSEPHVGGRTDFKFTQHINNSVLNIDAGGEWQEGFASVSVYKNVNGNADSLQTFDEINNRAGLIFAQIVLDNPQWTITASSSVNFLRVRFERFSPAPSGLQTRKFSDQLAPRFSIMKRFSNWNVYASVAKGFSPPSTAELLPSGGAVNLNLNAEEGTNYDIGAKATLFGKLYIDINAFLFRLQNTIVQRRNAAGGDFYINSGKTNQHGIETFISYPLFESSAFIKRSMLWFSHTWHDFHYTEFKQLTSDYSGNQMPGEPPHTISSGFDFTAKNGLSGAFTYYFNDRIPLNDANSAYAASYHIVGLKVGYEKIFKQKLRIKLAAGIDNLLNQKYSLGNDINGFGGRYYNAAAPRNYYILVTLQYLAKKQP